MTKIALVFLATWLVGCATYYDPNDPYVRGMRLFDSKNYEKARQQWEPLANAGDCDAQYRYGALYFFGAGVPEDFKTANKWWSTAANQGQAFAQMLLATMYGHDYMEIHTVAMKMYFNCESRSCGYEKDMVAAYQWMRLAEHYTPYEHFRKFSQEKAEHFKKSLTPEQISKADQYVQNWKPSPAQCKQRELR